MSLRLQKRFKVIVPTIATMSELELLESGIPIGQDNGITTNLTIKELDVFSTTVTAYFTIDKIINTYIAGFNISLAAFSDVKSLYNELLNYYIETNQEVARSINTPINVESRMDDILELLTSLKDKADNYIPPKKVTRDILVNDSYGLLKASGVPKKNNEDLTSISNRYKYW